MNKKRLQIKERFNLPVYIPDEKHLLDRTDAHSAPKKNKTDVSCMQQGSPLASLYIFGPYVAASSSSHFNHSAFDTALFWRFSLFSAIDS